MGTVAQELIPENYEGRKTDAEYSITAETEQKAKDLFDLAKSRLLDVNNWQDYSGPLTAAFRLTDEDGIPVNRFVKAGDHIKINIPAPGSAVGDGFDWVQVEAIDDETDAEGKEEAVAMRVRPTSNPKKNESEVAHFFTNEATSSFTIHRIGNIVTAGVHGRNEIPNTESENLLDKARNTMIALGAFVGLSKVQWKSLVKGLLENNDPSIQTI